ncbi:ion transporter [Myxococcota bacterium]|nr:ion transporter [Myxococcota bacterium]
MAAIISLAVLMFRSLLVDGSELATLLDHFDLAFCAIFFSDFIRQIVRAKDRRRYLSTWGIFDLASSVPAIDPLRIFRLARLIRVLRALRSIRILINVARRNRSSAVFVAAITTTMALFVGVCVAVLHLEMDAPGSNITDAEDVLWWAVVTSSTVGYGDHYPVTEGGRLLGAVLMFVGIGLFATASGSLGGMLIQSNRDQNAERLVDGEIRALRESVARIEGLLESRQPREEDSGPREPGPSGGTSGPPTGL